MKQMNSEQGSGCSASDETSSEIYPVANATHPYWRSELHPIDSHRTTPDLPASCSIAIIGAGMSGAALAYHLANLARSTTDPDFSTQPEIVMLEAREVCSGATDRNGGHVKVKTDTLLKKLKRDGLEAASQLCDLVHQQIYALKEVVEKEGLECEFELRRSFDVFLDASDAEEKRREFELCLRQGQRWTREVNWVGAEMAEQVTSLKGAKGAFSSPACSLWPYKFVTQILALAVDRKQLNLQTHTRVHSITTCPTTDQNILHTSRGDLRPRNVIFATNGYTAGISPPYAGNTVPYKGTATHLVPSAPISPHLSNTYNITLSPGRTDYLNPRPNGSIVVGGGSWTFSQDRTCWYNVWDDSTLLSQAEHHFREDYMQRVFKGWEDSGAGVREMWTGIMGATGDEWPHVGEVPGRADGRQWIMAGFNGGGMPMIWLTAKGLARMVREGVMFKETGLPAVFETSKERLGMQQAGRS